MSFIPKHDHGTLLQCLECGDLVTDPLSPSDPSALTPGWRRIPERILVEECLELGRRLVRVSMRGVPPSCLVTVTQHHC